jgi:hypothetical protein
VACFWADMVCAVPMRDARVRVAVPFPLGSTKRAEQAAARARDLLKGVYIVD